nr:DUF2961 domain-containing protein [Paenibacillus koleovorans]
MSKTALANLAKLGAGIRSRRQSSYDPTGGNVDVLDIKAGQTITLAEMATPGMIKHIWMTTFEKNFNLRALVIRMYWDGEETPSVQCPIGDFFLLGHARPTYVNAEPIQSMYLGMNCWFTMPYESALITITNDADFDSILYYYIDYHEVDELEKGLGRFHASWRRELVRQRPGTAYLIPVGGACPIALPVVRMAVLDAEPKRMLKVHRILDMEPILRVFSSVVGIAFERVTELRCAERFLQVVVVPGSAEIILHSGAMQRRRPLLSIEEEHIVAFAPPARLVRVEMDGAAYVVPFSFRLQDEKVVFPRRVQPLDRSFRQSHPLQVRRGGVGRRQTAQRVAVLTHLRREGHTRCQPQLAMYEITTRQGTDEPKARRRFNARLTFAVRKAGEHIVRVFLTTEQPGFPFGALVRISPLAEGGFAHPLE